MTREIVILVAGPEDTAAVAEVMASWPQELPAPVVAIAPALQPSASALPVLPVGDKDDLRPGHVHLAPLGYHVLVDGDSLALSLEAPVSGCRPSFEVLAESAARSFGSRVNAVLFAGAGADGARGAAAVRRRGGFVVACEEAPAEREIVDRVLGRRALGAALVERLADSVEWTS